MLIKFCMSYGFINDKLVMCSYFRLIRLKDERRIYKYTTQKRLAKNKVPKTIEGTCLSYIHFILCNITINAMPPIRFYKLLCTLSHICITDNTASPIPYNLHPLCTPLDNIIRCEKRQTLLSSQNNGRRTIGPHPVRREYLSHEPPPPHSLAYQRQTERGFHHSM